MERKPDTSLPPSFAANMQPNYLGSPKVVGSIIERFMEEIIGWVQLRRAGTMTAPQMAAQIHERSVEFASIFSGEDPQYQPIKGWNTRIGGLNEYLKSDLGHYWQSQRAAHEDDPYRVLYAWMCWAVVDGMNKSEDEDLVAVIMGDRIQKLIRMLTGSLKRA